jgi:hypothetical protein
MAITGGPLVEAMVAANWPIDPLAGKGIHPCLGVQSSARFQDARPPFGEDRLSAAAARSKALTAKDLGCRPMRPPAP